ncbi:MAG: site-2 protease family protein [Acidimicrobiales bacterium]
MRRDTKILVGALLVVLVIAIARGVINTTSLLLLLAIVPSVILHEVSHGIVANYFGDDTAKRAGRLSLNPLRHIDIFGTLILPAVMVIIGVPPLGYAKPVPVDVSRLRRPRNQSLYVSLAGPLVNIAISLVAGFVLRSVILGQLQATPLISQAQVGNGLWVLFLFYLGSTNLVLAIFNLIPIPPLDGSAIVERLLPRHLWPRYLMIRRFALPVVVGLFLLFPTAFTYLSTPIIAKWISLFVPGG